MLSEIMKVLEEELSNISLLEIGGGEPRVRVGFFLVEEEEAIGVPLFVEGAFVGLRLIADVLVELLLLVVIGSASFSSSERGSMKFQKPFASYFSSSSVSSLVCSVSSSSSSYSSSYSATEI